MTVQINGYKAYGLLIETYWFLGPENWVNSIKITKEKKKSVMSLTVGVYNLRLKSVRHISKQVGSMALTVDVWTYVTHSHHAHEGQTERGSFGFKACFAAVWCCCNNSNHETCKTFNGNLVQILHKCGKKHLENRCRSYVTRKKQLLHFVKLVSSCKRFKNLGRSPHNWQGWKSTFVSFVMTKQICHVL